MIDLCSFEAVKGEENLRRRTRGKGQDQEGVGPYPTRLRLEKGEN